MNHQKESDCIQGQAALQDLVYVITEPVGATVKRNIIKDDEVGRRKSDLLLP